MSSLPAAVMVNSGRGQEFRAPGVSIPTGEPPGEKRKYPVGGGAAGEEKILPRGRILFVLSSFFFQKHKHMAADGAGAVFGWCVLLPLPFAWLSAFFFFFKNELLSPAGS